MIIMEITQVAKIRGSQDGAIYGNELFRFNHRGDCAVYNLSDIGNSAIDELAPISLFTLGDTDKIVPHNNAVFFGCEFYDESDEYPLLYTNVYNNYAKEEDKKIGVCCVYRLQRLADGHMAKLVQIIEIGFTEDATLWKAYPDRHCTRPYGNFVIDKDKRALYAFVMRDEELGTRYFRFDMPSVHDGVLDSRYDVKKVVLDTSDIREYFDCGYHRFIQGAALHNNKIYSTEGFHDDEINRPAIRIVDLDSKKEEYIDVMNMGFSNEPEFIDFYNDVCYYSDAPGNLYVIDF